jgi:hypothetical protein
MYRSSPCSVNLSLDVGEQPDSHSGLENELPVSTGYKDG